MTYLSLLAGFLQFPINTICSNEPIYCGSQRRIENDNGVNDHKQHCYLMDLPTFQ